MAESEEDAAMFVPSFRDWLKEQEHKKGTVLFAGEWFLLFAAAFWFWTFIFPEHHESPWLTAAVAFISILYASGLVYARLLKLTACEKCRSPLIFSKREITRRQVREVEKCLEIERGGDEWYGHFVDLYSRLYRIEIIRFRCRRCQAVWDQVIEEPVSEYKLIRTIEIKD